jgi:hypothetical protein
MKQLGFARRHPCARDRALALGTVPVAAAVVGDDRMGAVLAARHMPAKGGRAAVLDGAHHLELLEADAAVVGMTPSGPVAAEDVRDVQSWASHAGPLRRRWSDYSVWYERREPIQRAHDFANEVGGDLGVPVNTKTAFAAAPIWGHHRGRRA